MRIQQLFAGVAVADYESALVWYTRFFGREPDITVADNESMWQVAAARWIYVVGDASRAGKALLTLLTDDLAAHVAELQGRGLAVGALDSAPGRYHRVVLTDPEGNMITLGELLGAGG